MQVLKQLGVTKGEKSIARSHIVIGKGGAVEDVQIGVSPGAQAAWEQYILVEPPVGKWIGIQDDGDPILPASFAKPTQGMRCCQRARAAVGLAESRS